MSPVKHPQRVEFQPGVTVKFPRLLSGPCPEHIQGKMKTAFNGEIHIPVATHLVDKIKIIRGHHRIDRPFDGPALVRRKSERLRPDSGFPVFAVLDVLNPEHIILRKKSDALPVPPVRKKYTGIAPAGIAAVIRRGVPSHIYGIECRGGRFITDFQSDQLIASARESIEDINPVFLP